jgi:hypothetical protein
VPGVGGELTYFDNGWAKTSTDPWDIIIIIITTTYDYNPLGQQTARTITSAGGSSSRGMTWGYFPDGKLQTRTDDGVPAGLQVVLVDNSDRQNTQTVGTWPVVTTPPGFQGIDYQTHAAGIGASTFTWNLNIPQDGTYQVLVNTLRSPARPAAPRSRSLTAPAPPTRRSTRPPTPAPGSAWAASPSPRPPRPRSC